MLNRFARALITKILSPVAGVLVRLGISPDVVTLVGTLAVCTAAMWFYPRGDFLVGSLVIAAFAFADSLDGIMARSTGRSSRWGAFLDSTLDRLADAAIFGGLVLYYAGRTGSQAQALAAAALACLVFGQVVSYARARAEGLGMTANVGIAERADRLVVVLAAVGLTDLFGLPEVVLLVVLTLLAVASMVTIVQRVLTVRHQALAAAAAEGNGV